MSAIKLSIPVLFLVCQASKINFTSTENIKHNSHNSTEKTSTSVEHTDTNLLQIQTALKDIAYYLRSHKFNDFDRRYETNAQKAPREYFSAFPRPPLRSLHWEVHRFCEPSFLSCVEYLKRRIRGTGLKRTDDTSVVIQEQKWNKHNHSQQINATDMECRKLLKAEEALANPFEGPIERFQWRVTASYYMCWYTMQRVKYLTHLKDNCDNFANCLDPQFGSNTNDPRANDSSEFACSLYSFCPDPCCPIKHMHSMGACWSLPDNPCFQANPANQRQCTLNQTQNVEFIDLVLNHWNVTCKCPRAGYEWSSRYGICIDIDECAGESHGCQVGQESCVNLPGSFRCACRWGYAWHPESKKCVASPALSLIKLRRSKTAKGQESKKATSLVKKLLQIFAPSGTCGSYHGSIPLCIASLLFNTLYDMSHKNV